MDIGDHQIEGVPADAIADMNVQLPNACGTSRIGDSNCLDLCVWHNQRGQAQILSDETPARDVGQGELEL